MSLLLSRSSCEADRMNLRGEEVILAEGFRVFSSPWWKAGPLGETSSIAEV